MLDKVAERAQEEMDEKISRKQIEVLKNTWTNHNTPVAVLHTLRLEKAQWTRAKAKVATVVVRAVNTWEGLLPQAEAACLHWTSWGFGMVRGVTNFMKMQCL